MAQITRDGTYIDTMERALYNTVLSGIAMDGKSFFYVNPLEVWPNNCLDHTSMDHVKPVRQKWFGVACCPPNIARTLASLGEYIYFTKNQDLWINMFVSGKTTLNTESGNLTITQKTRFPFEGSIQIHLESEIKESTGIALHIPSYAANYQITIDGNLVQPKIEKGYAYLEGIWTNTNINITFDMPAKFTYANPEVRADAGKVAIEKGPLVYCLEEIDNGDRLSGVYVNTTQPLEEQFDESLLGGTSVIMAKGRKITYQGWDEHTLYGETPPVYEDVTLKYIPYCYWGNRTPGEMTVWAKHCI